MRLSRPCSWETFFITSSLVSITCCSGPRIDSRSGSWTHRWCVFISTNLKYHLKVIGNGFGFVVFKINNCLLYHKTHLHVMIGHKSEQLLKNRTQRCVSISTNINLITKSLLFKFGPAFEPCCPLPTDFISYRPMVNANTEHCISRARET